MGNFAIIIIGIVGGIILTVALTTISIFLPIENRLCFKRIIRKYSKSPIDGVFQKTEKILGQIRKAVNSQLLGAEGVKLFNAIAQQKMILNRHDREAIAIFLNPEVFKQLMRSSLEGDKGINQVDNLSEILNDLEMPVGHLGSLPIYVSTSLKNAPVFVAGGITWELEE